MRITTHKNNSTAKIITSKGDYSVQEILLLYKRCKNFEEREQIINLLTHCITRLSELETMMETFK